MTHDLVAFLVRRALFALVLVIVVSSGALVLARLAPGDFVTEQVGQGADLATLAAERARLGLDRPVAASWAEWLGAAARLDFGVSFRYGRPVAGLVAERTGNTLLLAVAALGAATAIGLPLGVFAARRPRTAAAALVRAASFAALSVPPLVLALLLAWLAARTGWLPTGGMGRAAAADAGLAGRALDLARHLVLPALALALPVGATLERLATRALAGALAGPRAGAARARGLDEGRLAWRHALRLAAAPVVAVYGLVAGGLLSGSFAVEVVTAWPGLGRLFYEALVARDVPLVAGCAAASAALVAVATLAADAAAAWADPRVAQGGAA
ncbi:MAG: ABC transporter permease [Acidobacteria bacterium]|nr:ABC transporter permease [Acidobacteriota bacterium]